MCVKTICFIRINVSVDWLTIELESIEKGFAKRRQQVSQSEGKLEHIQPMAITTDSDEFVATFCQQQKQQQNDKQESTDKLQLFCFLFRYFFLFFIC